MMSEIKRGTSRILGSLTLRRDLSSIFFSRISFGVLTTNRLWLHSETVARSPT
jgi:hypothetical protein